MSKTKTVKDIMIGIFEYPHIPYWFSIVQAIRIVKVSFISTKKFPEPMAILVFDEKYNLMGTLTLKDILRGLEPALSKPDTKTGEPAAGESIALDALFDQGAKDHAEKPVSEIMVPAKHFVDPTDSIRKAAHIMLQQDLILLPVLENQTKCVGLVRMIELFDELSNEIL